MKKFIIEVKCLDETSFRDIERKLNELDAYSELVEVESEE